MGLITDLKRRAGKEKYHIEFVPKSRIKVNYRKTNAEDEAMVEAWNERVEEGLGRKLTKVEKLKERRRMI